MGEMDKISKVLGGRLEDLPPASAQMVRIFTSSTFTDTYEERNILMKNVYPKLKDYCKRKFGLEFQVVDMRWGVRDEATDDHMTSALCLEEIENCQRLSVGPNFVTFLGQRYGSRPFPAKIAENEMGVLVKSLESLEDEKRLSLLVEWYRKDENAIPSEFVLQPISSRIPNFTSEVSADRAEARSKWAEVSVNLRVALTKASTEAVQKGLLSADDQEKYLMSVTEEEIVHGLLRHNTAANEHCLCIIRLIEDIEENLQHNLAWRFIDQKENNNVDQEAQKRLKDLRDHKVINSLNRLNVYRYGVKWSEAGGINSSNHAQYLNDMSQKFYEGMQFLIDKAMMIERALRNDQVYMEAVQHMQMAKDRADIFHGREETLSIAQNYLTQDQSKILVLHGSSGCGKTSLMAVIAAKVRDWISGGKDANVILRFLGTTPMSTQLLSMLSSISEQVARLYNIKFTKESEPSLITKQFQEMIKKGTSAKPLVIVLDSLDQLSAANYAHKLSWLPKTLPSNCWIVVSTLPEHFGILNTLMHSSRPCNTIRIDPLGETLSIEILKIWLSRKGRKLADHQLQIATEAFKSCSLPIYVKLVYEQVLSWKSYDTPDQNRLSHTIQTVINDLFVRLEKKHGLLLVQRTLGYITASRGGLSEGEIEDLLSLDDDVLTDVFQYHVPPTRRIPSSLWVRIKHDIQSYLTKREADDMSVIYWYHRQFIEAAAERYVSKSKKLLHAMMADFYLEKWHNKEKPFKYTASQMKKLKQDNPNSQANRYVAPQPIFYTEDGSKRKYNLRKLNNLPYHLANAAEYETLKTECLFSYEWLFSKLQATSVQAILEDVAFFDEDSECELLGQVLNISRTTLVGNPETLPVEIIGRLKSSSQTHVVKLVRECYMEGSYDNALLPRQQCYPMSNEHLVFSLEHSDHPPNQKLLEFSPGDRALYIGTVNNTLLKWDLEMGEIEKEIVLGKIKDDVKFNLSGSNRDGTLIAVGTAFQKEKNHVLIIDGQEGEVVKRLELAKVYPGIGFIDDIQMFAIERELLVIIVKGKSVDCFDLDNGELVHTFEISPGVSCISMDFCKGLLSEKGTNNLHYCDFQSKKFDANFELQCQPMKLCLNSAFQKAIAAYSQSTGVSVIDLKTGIENTVHHSRNEKIEDASLSPSDNYLIIRGQCDIDIWHMKSEKHHCLFKIPDIAVPEYQRVTEFAVQMSKDDHKLVAGFNQHLIVFDMKSKSMMFAHDTMRRIHDLYLASDCSRAITTYLRNRLIEVWDLKGRAQKMDKPLSLKSGCRYMSLSRDSKTLAVRGYTSTECRVISLIQGCITSKPEVAIETMAPMMSRDGSVYLMRDIGKPGGSDIDTACIVVCNAKTGSMIGFIPVDGLLLKTVTIANNGQFLITHEEANPTDNVKLTKWRSSGGHEDVCLPSDLGGISFMFTADNDSVLVVQHQYPLLDEGRKCKIRVFDLADNVELYSIDNVLKDSLHVTPKGDKIVYVQTGADPSSDKVVFQHVRDRQVRKENSKLPVGRFDFSADASRAVDTNICAFDLENDMVLASFTDPIERLIEKHNQSWPKITGDGKYVAYLVIRKAVVQIGHIDSQQIVGRAFIHAASLSIELCGNMVIAGADDGRILIFEIHDSKNEEDENNQKLNDTMTFIPNISAIEYSGQVPHQPLAVKTACCRIL